MESKRRENGNAPDGRKVKATLHWVSAESSVPAEVRLYNPLFNRSDPDPGNFAAQIDIDECLLASAARVKVGAQCSNHRRE